MELTPEKIAEILHKHLDPIEAAEVIKVFLERPGAVAALMQAGPSVFMSEEIIVQWAKQIARHAKDTGDA